MSHFESLKIYGSKFPASQKWGRSSQIGQFPSTEKFFDIIGYFLWRAELNIILPLFSDSHQAHGNPEFNAELSLMSSELNCVIAALLAIIFIINCNNFYPFLNNSQII